MSYLERYEKRLNKNGSNAREAQLNQSIKAFDRQFASSPSYYQVDIDGEIVDVIINKTNRYEEKLINFRHEYSPKNGSIINFKSDRYLLMEHDADEIYRFGTMRRCNHFITVKFGEDREWTGYDKNGVPEYDVVPIVEEHPCVITSKYYSSNDNAQLPLPEGRISLFMKYFSERTNLQVNEEFILFDKRYIIADIDMTAIEDEKKSIGVIEVVLERKVSTK